jgi:CDP-glycerol glycerophosphotransferase (TagB/SpsB family)
MSFAPFLKFAQQADHRWHRRRNPESRTVLVDSRTPMNYAIMAPLHRAMRQDPRVTFYFTASEEPRRSAEIYREAGAGARLIRPARAALMKFDAYLTADQLWVKLPRGTRRVQMFHGVAGKYGHIYDAPERSMREWHRLFFINQRRLNNYTRNGAIDADSPAAKLIGMPKLDCLMDGSLQRDCVLRSLGIDPARTTVLYAPTWSPYSSVNAMGRELVERLCQAGYAVIVKLHDRSRDTEFVHSGGVDWGECLEPILERYDGHLAFGSDACPYLAAADVLITDHSSVGFEYLLLDRPVVRIEIPELIRKTNIHQDYVRMLQEVSASVENVKQTVEAVERSLAAPQAKSQERNQVAQELFYQPGTATARATRELYQVIDLDPIPVPQKNESTPLFA